MAANDVQVGGDHYKQHGATGEQHWDRVARIKLDYMQSQITKYVERCWDKNGILDLEKAGHFIAKYIEQSRAAGRLGKVEEQHLKIGQEMQRLRSLEIDMVRESADPMQHYSTAAFCLEGIKENTVHYRCRRCREHMHIQLHQRPDVVHVCPDGSEANAAYAGQD